jgi:hypothetical protein
MVWLEGMLISTLLGIKADQMALEGIFTLPKRLLRLRVMRVSWFVSQVFFLCYKI